MSVVFEGVGANGTPESVGESDNTTVPVPVSSVNAVAISEEVNEPKLVAFPDEVIAPVKFAFVTTVVTLPFEVTIPVNEESDPEGFDHDNVPEPFVDKN